MKKKKKRSVDFGRRATVGQPAAQSFQFLDVVRDVVELDDERRPFVGRRSRRVGQRHVRGGGHRVRGLPTVRRVEDAAAAAAAVTAHDESQQDGGNRPQEIPTVTQDQTPRAAHVFHGSHDAPPTR